MLRSIGQALDKVGIMFQANNAVVETLVPSTRVVSHKGKSLTYGLQAFVAPTANVVGDVQLGELSSVWYGATVRGDSASVRIGKNTAVQDTAVVEGSGSKPVALGNNVTVAPGAMVLSATVEDGAMIGMGARLLPGAVVGSNAYVDAGAVVPAGTNVPAGELWTGNPARKLRALGADEIEFLQHTADLNAQLSQHHFKQTSKSVEEVEADVALKDYREEHYMEPDEPIPEDDPDIVQYYKLSEDRLKEGLFREDQLTDEEAHQALVSKQTAADLEEERFLTEKVQARAAADAAAEESRQRKLKSLP